MSCCLRLKRKTQLGLALFYLVIAILAGSGELQLRAHEELELTVGRSAAGKLKVRMHFTQPIVLPESIFPGIPGFAIGELAFHSTILDESAEDFFKLSESANLRFVLLAKDPGVEVWNDTGSGFMATNTTFFIGTAPFDAHPIWNIVSGTSGNSYALTLKLRDLNGVYSDGEPFVLSFTPIEMGYRLNIHFSNAQSVTLSWPTNAIGWVLQSAGSPMTQNWTAITNSVGVIGTNFSLNLATTNTQQYFRLRKP